MLYRNSAAKILFSCVKYRVGQKHWTIFKNLWLLYDEAQIVENSSSICLICLRTGYSSAWQEARLIDVDWRRAVYMYLLTYLLTQKSTNPCIKMFSSLSAVRLVFWASPNLKYHLQKFRATAVGHLAYTEITN